LETLKNLSFLRRALQSIPPRELQFIYLQQSKGLVQQETGAMYNVQQQNVSYRIMRASERIILHYKLFQMCSETSLRRYLFDHGFSETVVQIISAIVKTSSQAAASRALAISPGSVRYTFLRVVSQLEETDREHPVLLMIKLIERNLNQLRSTDAQERWAHKSRRGVGNRPTEDQESVNLLEL
jgi:hypothetical protein